MQDEKQLIADLKYFWEKPIEIENASYFWRPGTKIAFFADDNDRFEFRTREFEKRHGHCYCYTSDQLMRVPIRYRERSLMVEMFQSIIRDKVDPESVGMAFCQVWHDILSEDTTHDIFRKYWGKK
jgi:hypothetical protein